MKEGIIFTKIKNVTTAIILSYIVTFFLLLFVAFVMFSTDISDKVINALIFGVYFLSALAGGVKAGKRIERKKYIGGIVVGVIYALIIVIASIIISMGNINIEAYAFMSLFSIIGGMIGGMLS